MFFVLISETCQIEQKEIFSCWKFDEKLSQVQSFLPDDPAFFIVSTSTVSGGGVFSHCADV